MYNPTARGQCYCCELFVVLDALTLTTITFSTVLDSCPTLFLLHLGGDIFSDSTVRGQSLVVSSISSLAVNAADITDTDSERIKD